MFHEIKHYFIDLNDDKMLQLFQLFHKNNIVFALNIDKHELQNVCLGKVFVRAFCVLVPELKDNNTQVINCLWFK